MNKHRPIALIILDGWGHRDQSAHNPLRTVATPTIDRLDRDFPAIFLDASGPAVGLPEGQMGNSEVGHLHIGAGRKVPQDLTRINTSIQQGSFFQNPVLLSALESAKANHRRVHLIGLVSPGGVHSQVEHIAALIQLVHQVGVAEHCLHAILDGRDTPPRSAKTSLEHLAALYQSLGSGRIASLVGRYYAMDRDQRWERTQAAYDLLTLGHADFVATDPLAGLEHAYVNGQGDEFVKPTAITPAGQDPVVIEDGDVVIFANFRADRARQLSFALTDPNFRGFSRQRRPLLSHFVTLTEYAPELAAEVAYPPMVLNNTLGQYAAKHGLRQLRLAETEKYAHVTYFINGGDETQLPGEDRLLVPSPKVATYDLQPEMSALELTNQLVQAIQSQRYDLIICNYANPDMVGHTGNMQAAEQAVSVIDRCLAQVLAALMQVGGEAIITADHGNIECMYDEVHHQPHTAHTTNLVPLYYVGKSAKLIQQLGALDDIAPTILTLLGLSPPAEMTGKILVQINK